MRFGITSDGRYALASEGLDFPFRARIKNEQIIWESNGIVDFSHLKIIATNAQKHRQSLHVNAGSHGEKLALPILLREGITRIFLSFPNVSHHNVSSHSEPIYPPKADQVINVWCFSESSERPIVNLSLLSHVVNDETAPKASSRLPGISFNDLKDRVYRLFVKNAPAWRHVGNGLNLEAECKTKSCLAYKKLVWIHQGTGKFDVFELIFKGTKCPMCHQDTENAISLGYVNCFVNIEGDQVPSLGGSIRCVETCQDGGIVTYTHKATKWIRLAITLTSKAP